MSGRLARPFFALTALGLLFAHDSLAQVFAGAGSDTKLHITWPHGRAAVVSVPDDAKSIKISIPDEVQIMH